MATASGAHFRQLSTQAARSLWQRRVANRPTHNGASESGCGQGPERPATHDLAIRPCNQRDIEAWSSSQPGGPARSGGGARSAGQSGAARRAARQPRSTRREFIQVLFEVVRSAGSTALLSPHVVVDVEDACDRVAIMGTSEICFQSSDSPKSEFVRRSGSAEN
jgi:hypothetical protein